MAPIQKLGMSKQNYQTPPEFSQAALRKLDWLGWNFDVAADENNSQALFKTCFFNEEENGLAHDWTTFGWNWLNPPYENIAPWVERAWKQSQRVPGASTAVLVPGSHGANWWKLWVDGKAQVLDLNGRITFVGQTDPYPKDCALLLYGPDVVPGYEIWTWMNDLTEEERQMAKTRIVKTKSDNVTNISDGPKTRKGKKFAHSLANAIVDPVVDVASTPPDPPASVHVRMPDDFAQGASDPEKLLKELGALNDRALEAKTRYEGLKEDTKQARETYDSLASEVLRKIQAATHPPALPLFDAEQRESDLLRMQAGPEDFGAVSATESVSEGEPSQDTDGAEIVGGAPAGEASAPILEDSIF